MKILRPIALTMFIAAAPVFAQNGLVVKKSAYDVVRTLDRLEQVLKEKGLSIVARVDHGAGAAKVGMSLRPTQLLIFGNPKLGSALMQSNQTVGIDLPMKVLAWRDAQGQTWIAYNQPAHVAGRHQIKDRDDVVGKMSGALGKLTDKAVQ